MQNWVANMEDMERLAQEEIDLALENIADIDDFDTDEDDGEEMARVTSALAGGEDSPEITREASEINGEDVAPASPKRQKSMDRPPPATSLSRAAFHIFKSNVGAGLFLLPTFYTNCGSLAGLFMALLAGAILLDCTLMLLKAKNRISRPDAQTYPAVVGFVLGGGMKNFVKFALVLTQFGFCTMYIQYTASLCAELLPFYNSYYVFVLASVAIVTPMTFLTGKLHILAFASILASVCVFFVIFGSLFLSFETLAERGVSDAKVIVWPPSKWILFLAGHVMALEGIGVVLPVENSVKDKEKFPMVIKRTIGSIIAGFIFFGQIGYLAFGSRLKSSIVHAFEETYFTAMLQLALAMSLLLSYPIQYVPAIQIVDRALKVKSPNSFQAKLLRVSLNIFFGLTASMVGGETLGLFAEFLGAFAGTHLTTTFPSLLTLLVNDALEGKRHSLTSREYFGSIFKNLDRQRIKCLLYLAFGLTIFVVGTLTVVFEGVEMLTRPPPEKVVFVPVPEPTEEIISTVAPLPTSVINNSNIPVANVTGAPSP